MAARATRTLNQLHFEDLEPHRFEDMVRQLVYDFRTWGKLEATGRLGADDGIDIRGIEVGVVVPGDGEQEEPAETPERVWVIQCKREKELGPTEVGKIVRDAVPRGGDAPYGLILAAACDFSKRSMDTFHSEAKKTGVTESYIWGKATLEDMLFQPRYDHLLFAYFNISLQVRRRSLRTSVRSRLATKKALISALGGFDTEDDFPRVVLIRDVSEERYPHDESVPDFAERPRWRFATFLGHEPHDHLAFILTEHFAYADKATEAWDAMFDYPVMPAVPERRVRSLLGHKVDDAYRAYQTQWMKLVSEKHRAMLKRGRVIHYDRVIAIDSDGDCKYPGPHVLVEPHPRHGLFEPFQFDFIKFGGYGLGFQSEFFTEESKRVKFFQSPLRIQSEGAGGGRGTDSVSVNRLAGVEDGDAPPHAPVKSL